MSEGIIVGIISAVVSLIGIFMTARNTRDSLTHTLDAHQQVMDNEINHIKSEISEIKSDVKSHNQYAKLFNENIPVIKEQLKAGERRFDTVEQDIRDIRQGSKTK